MRFPSPLLRPWSKFLIFIHCSNAYEYNFLDYDIAKNLATQAGYTVTEFDEEYAQHFTGYRYEPGPGPSIMASQPKENDMKFFNWRYTHILEDIEYTPEKIGLRDIATLDSLADVLLKVGFTTASDIAEAANSAVEKVRGVHYSNFEEMRNYIDSFQKRASYNSEQVFLN